MYPNPRSPLQMVCHPYMFALKEGKTYKNNMMDYSLMLLQCTCAEHIKSPTEKRSRAFFANSIPVYVKNHPGAKTPN